MNLQQQLEYNWERQVYSVVKDINGFYWIISTKVEDLGTGGFRRSVGSSHLSECKSTVGDSALTGEQIDDCEEKCGWKIVDTIHPSELMGNGFQVGDKVLLITGNGTTKESVVTNVANGGDGNRYELKCYPHVSFPHMRLKPVLPVEEKTDLEKILGCKLVADEKIPDGVIALVDSKGKVVAAIKDGYIVNL